MGRKVSSLRRFVECETSACTGKDSVIHRVTSFSFFFSFASYGLPSQESQSGPICIRMLNLFSRSPNGYKSQEEAKRGRSVEQSKGENARRMKMLQTCWSKGRRGGSGHSFDGRGGALGSKYPDLGEGRLVHSSRAKTLTRKPRPDSATAWLALSCLALGVLGDISPSV